MPDLTDDLRVINETPETIKARLLADTNAGIDPNDPAYLDTVIGSMWDDLNGARVLEDDRIYDRMNEIVANAIPATTSGAFMDAWAESLGLERTAAAYAGGVVTFFGANGTIIAEGTQVSTVATDAETAPVTFVTIEAGTIASGNVDLEVRAVVAGSEGIVPAATITLVDTSLPAVTSITNDEATSGGADIQTDEALLTRILRKLAGAGGGGNQDQYVEWGLGYPGVAYVTVQPNTPSLGHVTVVITDINNSPMPTFAVSGLQERLDPSATPTQGAGLAPPGATVHVATPATTAVAAVAVVALAPGYTLDGAGGTIAVRADIQESLARYVNTLPAGGDVIRFKAVAAIVDVIGVVDLTSLTLNAGTGNVAIDATHVARLTTPIGLS